MKKTYGLIIFDMDGTLTTTRSGAKFRKTPDDWKWLPGVVEKLRKLRDNGVLLGLATNQGGIAFGLLDYEAMLAELTRMCLSCGIGYWRMCPFHPGGKIEAFTGHSPDRKPATGMLHSIMTEAGSIAAEDTLVVGDRREDEEAAKAAGVDFMLATAFFSEDEKVEAAYDDQDLNALEELLGVELKVLESEQRVYLSGGTYGSSKYHILEKRYDGIQIEQIEIDKEWSKRVSLSGDQVPELLKTLLVWYFEKWKDEHKEPDKDVDKDELGDLNDSPF